MTPSEKKKKNCAHLEFFQLYTDEGDDDLLL